MLRRGPLLQHPPKESKFHFLRRAVLAIATGAAMALLLSAPVTPPTNYDYTSSAAIAGTAAASSASVAAAASSASVVAEPEPKAPTKVAAVLVIKFDRAPADGAIEFLKALYTEHFDRVVFSGPPTTPGAVGFAAGDSGYYSCAGDCTGEKASEFDYACAADLLEAFKPADGGDANGRGVLFVQDDVGFRLSAVAKLPLDQAWGLKPNIMLNLTAVSGLDLASRKNEDKRPANLKNWHWWWADSQCVTGVGGKPVAMGLPAIIEAWADLPERHRAFWDAKYHGGVIAVLSISIRPLYCPAVVPFGLFCCYANQQNHATSPNACHRHHPHRPGGRRLLRPVCARRLVHRAGSPVFQAPRVQGDCDTHHPRLCGHRGRPRYAGDRRPVAVGRRPGGRDADQAGANVSQFCAPPRVLTAGQEGAAGIALCLVSGEPPPHPTPPHHHHHHRPTTHTQGRGAPAVEGHGHHFGPRVSVWFVAHS